MKCLKALPAVILALSIVGCAGSTPAITSTVTPTTSAEVANPVPSLSPTVERVTVLADSIIVTDSTGTVVESVDFFTAPSDIRQILTGAFGFEPDLVSVEECACDGIYPVQHNWDGFMLMGRSRSGESGEAPYSPAVVVWVTTASVRGVVVDTFEGARVGDEVALLPTSDPRLAEYYSVPDQPDRTYFHIGTIAVPDDKPRVGFSGTNLSYSVVVTSNVDDGVVAKIISPVSNGFGL